MSTIKEVKLNYSPDNDIDNNEEDEYKNDIRSYRDEIGDDDYDYINNYKHSSYNDEYYD